MSDAELLGWSMPEHQQKKPCQGTAAKALQVLPLSWGSSQPSSAASSAPVALPQQLPGLSLSGNVLSPAVLNYQCPLARGEDCFDSIHLWALLCVLGEAITSCFVSVFSCCSR